MRDRDDRLIAESMYVKPAKQVGADLGQHLNVADQLYQALTTEIDPGQLTDDDIDNLVIAWVGKQEWIPSEFGAGLSEYLGNSLKGMRDERISGTVGGVEEGADSDPDKHAKQVQWTKDVKAKLAQAQKIGDSKEANKLQRFLDMHGIDEAGDPATQQPKRRRADDPDWRKRGSIKKKLDKRSDQLARDRRRRSVQGAPKWYKDQKESE